MMTKDISLNQQEQIQRLMQIGAYLRQMREDQALSLEDVAARTLIQPRLLKAIESGEMHQLPEPVYIQGFIKRYADSLGLDGTDCANAFPTDRMMRVPQQSTWTDSPTAQLRPLHLYVAYIALIMASVSLLSYIVGRSSPATSVLSSSRTDTEQPAGRTSAAPRGTTSGTTLGIDAGATSSATSSPTSGKPSGNANLGLAPIATSPTPTRSADPSKPIQVEMKLTAQSWIEVEVDGTVKLAEVLQEGAERSWTADKELRVRSGNAGGVVLAYNGGASEKMGAPGAVEEKTFSPGVSVSASSSQAAAGTAKPRN
jgi:cytoskeletal protein RodZ